MSRFPPIQIPDVATSSQRVAVETPVTLKTPKSLLKNLFKWKKASTTPDAVIVSPADMRAEGRPQTACSTKQVRSRKPSFSQRSTSDNAVPQRSKSKSGSKLRRRSRSHCRAIWDPPPLFQAYNQAFMHDVLQIPNKGFLDWLPRNSSGRPSAKSSEAVEDDHNVARLPVMSHRRSLSDSIVSALSKKQIFLFENGHILQYKTEGSQDRLPERVLELSRDSVAFASDAVAGQPYVLEICPYGRVEGDSKGASSRSPWSRMSLKAPDTKKFAEKLLIVFDNADKLFTWLIAIRKQIEGLGGIEYQPDTSSPSFETQPKRPTLRHASSEYFKRKNNSLFSRSSSALPLNLYDHTAHEKELPRIPAHLSYKPSVSTRSITASSVATITSLDRYRESYSGSSTAGTTQSSDTSASSLSPTRETFAPMLSPVLGKSFKEWYNIDRPIPRTPTSPLFNSEEIETAAVTTVAENSTGSPAPEVPPTQIADPIPNNTNSESGLVPQAVPDVDASAESQNVPVSMLDPAPVPEFRKRLRQAQRYLSAVESGNKLTTIVPSSSSSVHENVPKLNQVASKGSYGLFPKKLSIGVQAEPLVLAEQNHVPGLSRMQATDHLEISESPVTPVAAVSTENVFARAQAHSKRPAPIDLSGYLSALELDQPLRSPAVTDAMLDSNFGTGYIGTGLESPTPVDIRVPSFSDLNIDRHLLNSLKEIERKTTSSTISPDRRSLNSRRSMPSVRNGTSGAPSAPVGPPPKGPLPAVPPPREGRNSRNSTPSKRTSTQSSGNRRASAKSVASMQKSKIVPSCSLLSAHRHRSLSSGVRSPAVNDAQSGFPFSWTASSPELPTLPSSIGQLSVVHLPPCTANTSRHKKSLSTSSITSNDFKKTHKRSTSVKSMHLTVSNVDSISQPVPPIIGLQIDMGSNAKYTFI